MKTYYLINPRLEILRKIIARDLHLAVIEFKYLTGLTCDEKNVLTSWDLKLMRAT